MNASLFDCLLPEQQLKWKSRMKKETLKISLLKIPDTLSGVIAIHFAIKGLVYSRKTRV